MLSINVAIIAILAVTAAATTPPVRLPPTFTTTLIERGDPIQFPTFCTVLNNDATQSSPVDQSETPVPIPCRPALFGAKAYTNNKIQVVWYHNNGCSETPAPLNNIDYTDKFVLISRGTCPFVTKTFNAQTNNASGVIIVDHPTKESEIPQILMGRGSSAEASLIKMWSEIKDKHISDQIHIPLLSIRNSDATMMNNQWVKFHWTTKCRAQLAYISGKDRLARYPDHWNATKDHVSQSQSLYKSLGLSSAMLQLYQESESFLRLAVAAYPPKSPKAVPVIHKLGVLLLNRTDNITKWKEAYSLLPGSKAYQNSLAEVLIHRVAHERYPAYLMNPNTTINATTNVLASIYAHEKASQSKTAAKQSLCFDGLVVLSKAAKIRGGVYTPRVAMNQATLMGELNMDRDFIRDKIMECLEDSVAYGDEL